MTKNWSRLTVVTLFILLAFTASASAECAWVLWSSQWKKGTDLATMRYEVNLAYPTREECGAAIRTTTESFRKTRPWFKTYQAKSSPYEVLMEDATGEVRYFCLPDTVDPRGPKGK